MHATTVVTGASGFIGRAVVAELLGAGEPVAAFVRDEPTVALLGEHPALRVVHTSLATTEEVQAALDELGAVRAVIHLAGGRVAGGVPSLAPNLALNVDPTACMLGALAGRSATFVLASTGEIYGAQPAPFHEELAVAPPSPYAVSKHAAEVLTLGCARSFGIPAVVARLGVVYGPRQGDRTMLVPALFDAGRAAKAAPRRFPMSSGVQTRDFVYLADAAHALIALSRLEARGGQIVNVGTGVGLPVREVATRVVAAIGSPLELEFGAIPHRPGDVMDYRLAPEKLERLTGFRPRISVDEGIARALAEGEA